MLQGAGKRATVHHLFHSISCVSDWTRIAHVGILLYHFLNTAERKTICNYLNKMPKKTWFFGVRRVWRYQRGNHNPYIEEEQTTQWPKEKGQKDKQRSTKHTYKTKDRVTRTPLKTGGELRWQWTHFYYCAIRSPNKFIHIPLEKQ
jgi:hypothetical protein